MYAQERAEMDYAYFPSYDTQPGRRSLHDSIVTFIFQRFSLSKPDSDPVSDTKTGGAASKSFGNAICKTPEAGCKGDQDVSKHSCATTEASANASEPTIKAESGSKERPWLIYTCGCYGSGKSHTMRTLWGDYLLNGAVYIDPDVVKTLLLQSMKSTAEMHSGAEMRKDEKEFHAELHKESTFVALLAERVALANGISAVVDGSLHDHEWYTLHLSAIRAKYPQYKICIVKIECALETVLERCAKRALVTKRSISDSLVRHIYTKLPDAFAKLAPLADCWIRCDNNVKKTSGESMLPTVTEIHLNLAKSGHSLSRHIPPFIKL